MAHKRELGFIGFGSFGKFIMPYLTPYFSVVVYDKRDVSEECKSLKISQVNLKEVAAKEIIVLAVPVQFLETVIQEIVPFLQEKALIIDVSSVKVKPMLLMEKYFPKTVQIVGTHPLFGPQSGKNGIQGLNCVLCPVRTNHTEIIRKFFSNSLKLNVLERSPELHDRQMAYVQALTHFVGRAVNNMDIPDVEQKTPAYQYLLDIKRNLGQDSMDLFLTIENENPYAKDVRKQFVKELENLEKNLL